MSYQDPDGQRRADEYIDRAGEGLGMAPIVLGIAVVAILAFLFFWTPRQAEQSTVGQPGELPKTAPSAPTPPAPGPQKSPQ